MPLLVIVLLVRFPHLVVEFENHVAVFQSNTHPVSLQHRAAKPELNCGADLCLAAAHSKTNAGPDQLLVLEDETPALRALESQGHGDVIIQAEVLEVCRQAALEVELCFADGLSGRDIPI